jgi:hypothetical protein
MAPLDSSRYVCEHREHRGVARATCARSLARAAVPASVLPLAVESYWQCVAAQIEAGLVDDDGDDVRR